MTKVLIVDDHEVILEGLEAVLDKHEGVEIVGVASDGRDALQKVKSLNPRLLSWISPCPTSTELKPHIRLRS